MGKLKKIGIITADTDEFAPLAGIIEKGEYTEESFLKRRALHFKTENAEITALHCGVGKVNAAAAAMHLIDTGCEIILNYGLSGGLGKAVRGGLYLCDKFSEHDFDLTMIGYKPCEKPDQETYIYNADERLNALIKETVKGINVGAAVTGDSFICDSKKSEYLSKAFGAVSCDMETAAMAYVCEYSGVPFVAVRKISDGADEQAAENYREENTSGKEDLQRLILKIADIAAKRL